MIALKWHKFGDNQLNGFWDIRQKHLITFFFFSCSKFLETDQILAPPPPVGKFFG